MMREWGLLQLRLGPALLAEGLPVNCTLMLNLSGRWEMEAYCPSAAIDVWGPFLVRGGGEGTTYDIAALGALERRLVDTGEYYVMDPVVIEVLNVGGVCASLSGSEIEEQCEAAALAAGSVLTWEVHGLFESLERSVPLKTRSRCLSLLAWALAQKGLPYEAMGTLNVIRDCGPLQDVCPISREFLALLVRVLDERVSKPEKSRALQGYIAVLSRRCSELYR
jgi:hypothetical protein